MKPRPHVPVAALLGLAALFALSACGSSGAPAGSADDDAGPAISATPTAQVSTAPPADAKVIAVTIDKNAVSPVGAQAKVSTNQPVVFQIHASVAGELHVHSSPEQHVEFPVGDSQITLSFDKPGLIEVEDHALNQLIVQLEVG